MFNNLIRRNFDIILDGPSNTEKINTIFNPSVRDALHCVLSELIQIAQGERSASEFPVAIKKFQIYFNEAKRIFRRYLKVTLLHLDTCSLEQEAGCRIACHFEYQINLGGESWKRPATTYGLIPEILAWLSEPVKDFDMVMSLSLIKNFNSQLDDNLVREEFLANDDWLLRY